MTDRITYGTAVRSFDHAALAGLASYPALREAINDFANEADAPLAYVLDAIRDMVLTAPYADCCDRCRQHPDYVGPDGNADYLKMAWPYVVERKGDWLRCTYRCPRCSYVWTCGYSVHSPEFM